MLVFFARLNIILENYGGRGESEKMIRKRKKAFVFSVSVWYI